MTSNTLGDPVLIHTTRKRHDREYETHVGGEPNFMKLEGDVPKHAFFENSLVSHEAGLQSRPTTRERRQEWSSSNPLLHLLMRLLASWP